MSGSRLFATELPTPSARREAWCGRRSLGWAALVLVSACGGGGGYSMPSSPNTTPGTGGPPSAPTAPTCALTTAQAVTNVTMQNLAFNPSCVKVAPGALVTFTNQDNTAHTVTTDAGQPETFDSGVVQPGAAYQHTFATTGTIGIHCTIHGPMMHVTVVVDPSVTTSSSGSNPGTSMGGMGGGYGGG